MAGRHAPADPADPALRALPHGLANRLMAEQFDAVAQRFIAAFQAALPQLSRAEIVWRYEFARGAVVHVLADCDPESGRLAALSADACRTGDEAELLAQATAFVRLPCAGRPNCRNMRRMRASTAWVGGGCHPQNATGASLGHVIAGFHASCVSTQGRPYELRRPTITVAWR